MQELTPISSTKALSQAWCNGDALASATIEAVSFVTPALERFFILTVSACLADIDDAPLAAACRDFVREEAEHTGAHRKLNGALLDYLQNVPPGLPAIERLLNAAHRRLALSSRVALVAALEHLTAVLSKSYLRNHRTWQMQCAYARDLFEQHAEEEIAHRSVAFDLWLSRGGGHASTRILALMAVLTAGLGYLSLAVPWILHKKCRSWLAMIKTPWWRLLPRTPFPGATTADLLRYLHPAYHPRQLVQDTPPVAG